MEVTGEGTPETTGYLEVMLMILVMMMLLMMMIQVMMMLMMMMMTAMMIMMFVKGVLKTMGCHEVIQLSSVYFNPHT